MTEHAMELLEELRQDKHRTAIFVDSRSGGHVEVNGKTLGEGDVDQAIRYRSAMDELVGMELARSVTQNSIQLTAKGLDWKPQEGRVREL